MHQFYSKKDPRALFITLFTFLCFTYTLKAQTSPADSMVIYKLQTIEKTLQQDKVHTSHWWWGWLSGYGAATIGQGIVGGISGKVHMRQDMFLSAATTFAGVIGQFVTPVSPYQVPIQLNYIQQPGSSENLKQLNFAEEILRNRALKETKGRSWQAHAVSGAVNLASGLVTWVGFKRSWKDGLTNFLLNTAVTEAQIWSQPVLAKRAWTHYGTQTQTKGGLVYKEKKANKYVFSASFNGIEFRMAL
jgi:hypothetical protein